MEQSIGIVFLHGAGLNSSIWQNVIEKLNFQSLTIDFPNRKISGKPNHKLTFNDYTDACISAIESSNLDSFILVAHSISACVGLSIARRFARRLKGFVAISSIIPLQGHSFLSTLPFPQKLLLPIIMKLFGTKPPKSAIETELCHDLSQEDTATITRDFTAEALSLYTTKIHYTLPDTQRLYVKLNFDTSLPLSFQDNMSKNLNATQVAIIDSGHLPMLSKPDEVANIIAEFITYLK